jgi:ABC-type transporter Mla subunit MlaD
MRGILHKPVIWIGVLAVIAIAVIVFVALYSGGGSGGGY